MPLWAMFVIAVCAEVLATSALRESDGFTRLVPVAIMLAGYAVAFYLLSLIVREMSLGLAYAIWAGAGTALVALVGWFAFSEKLELGALAGIALVVTGIVVINLSGST